jgi:hypothetical protein
LVIVGFFGPQQLRLVDPVHLVSLRNITMTNRNAGKCRGKCAVVFNCTTVSSINVVRHLPFLKSRKLTKKFNINTAFLFINST